MSLLGYIPAHIKISLVDKDIDVYAYGLSLAVVEYQITVQRGDMDTAREPLAEFLPEHKNNHQGNKVSFSLQLARKSSKTFWM